jgi:hypothetical protein
MEDTDFTCTNCEDTGQIEYELLCGHDGVRYEYRACPCDAAQDADDDDLEYRLDRAIERAQCAFELRMTEVSL